MGPTATTESSNTEGEDQNNSVTLEESAASTSIISTSHIDCSSSPCADNEYCIEDGLTYTCVNCEGTFVDGVCECTEGFRGTACEIEFVSLAIVLSMSYPDNEDEFTQNFEAEMENALDIGQGSVEVTSISSFDPESINRRWLDELLLIEFEILVSDISGNSETLIEIIVDQLSDPNSVLLSGVIGSTISTEFGLFYVSDDGTVSGNEQLIFTSYIASTTSTSAADFSVTVASAL